MLLFGSCMEVFISSVYEGVSIAVYSCIYSVLCSHSLSDYPHGITILFCFSVVVICAVTTVSQQ